MLSGTRAPVLRSILGGAAILLVALAPAAADEVVLGAQMDTSIYEESPTNSNGSGPHIYSGQTSGSNLRRALLMFDVSAIPTDATITAVSLALAMNNGTPLATTHTLHRVTAAWGEAGSDAGTPGGLGAPAQTGDATWTFRLYDTDAWTTPGGDYETDASATTSIGGAGSYEISSQGMIDDVQAWVTGTVVNDGWIFLGDESSVQTAKRFASKENPTASARPALTVTYTTASPTKTRSWSAIKSRYVR